MLDSINAKQIQWFDAFATAWMMRSLPATSRSGIDCRFSVGRPRRRHIALVWQRPVGENKTAP
jgi:hypothetical protein